MNRPTRTSGRNLEEVRRPAQPVTPSRRRAKVEAIEASIDATEPVEQPEPVEASEASGDE